MSRTAPATTGGIFQIKRQGDTLIVVPVVDLSELDYQRINAGARAILAALDGTNIKNVVLDLSRTDYYGSTALGFFLNLWKKVRSWKGRMAFCNVSEYEREILRVTELDNLWPICSSRSEALAAVRE